MKNDETLEYLISQGVVAVIRMKDPERLAKVVGADAGGVKCIEITMTVPAVASSHTW